MKRGIYVGVDRHIRGKTALVQTAGTRLGKYVIPDGRVMVQLHDVSTRLSVHGWHEFPEYDWEITDEPN